MNLGVVAQPQLDRVDAQCVGQLVERGFQREVALGPARGTHPVRGWDVQPRPPVVCRHVRAGVRVARDLRDGLEAPVAQGPERRGGLVIDRDQPAIAGGTEPHPLHVSPAGGRRTVNICGRVSTSLTGRPTTRAASAVRITCGQARSAAPKPPPRYGTRTRTSVSGSSNAAARAVRVLIGSWLVSCTVSRSPSQRATVAKSPIGLLVTAAVVKISS